MTLFMVLNTIFIVLNIALIIHHKVWAKRKDNEYIKLITNMGVDNQEVIKELKKTKTLIKELIEKITTYVRS